MPSLLTDAARYILLFFAYSTKQIVDSKQKFSYVAPRPIEPEKYRTVYLWGVPKEVRLS